MAGIALEEIAHLADQLEHLHFFNRTNAVGRLDPGVGSCRWNAYIAVLH
jgi:hypothetical protein